MTNPDFTIADVLAWARRRPADARYDYQDSFNCALCCFLRDTGRAAVPVVSSYFYGCGGWREASAEAEHPYDEALDEAVSAGILDWVSHDRPEWTFGALVKRLEALCPETPVIASNWAAIDAYLSELELVGELS